MTLQPAFPSSATASPALKLAGSGFSYGAHPVLGPFTLDIAAGETIAILGQSGCGKSTLLKVIAGLLPGLSSTLAGKVAWMAQQDLLLPWASIRENAVLGARLRGKEPDYTRADDLLLRLGLTDWADTLPAKLSGGMRQRAALARTLMEDRPLVLMDEPFSSLDSVTRAAMQTLAGKVLAGRAVLLVTHDPAEACRMADRIYVLAGRPASLQPVIELSGPKPRDPLSQAILPALRAVQAVLEANP